MTESLFRHLGSLVAGHVGGFVLTALAIKHIGCTSFLVFSAAFVTLAALRAFVFYKARRTLDPADPRHIIRWRGPYLAVSVAWCVVSAALCCFCFMQGDGTLRVTTSFLILGTTGGIASRNACSPRLALLQIVIWLLPAVHNAMRMYENSWILTLMIGVYFAALYSIVKRNYNDMVALIDAERTSQIAQSKLLEREAEVLGIFENAAAGVTEFDVTSARFVRVNRIFCDMIGYTAAELLDGISPWDITHPEDRAHQAAQWAGIQRDGQSFEGERRYLRSDGTVVWGRVGVSVAARTADGRPSRLITVLQDITALKVAGAALRASQNLLRLSLDIGGVGTFRCDYRAGLICCGPETRQMSGLPAGDEPITVDVWLATVSAEDRPRVWKDFTSAYADRRPIAAFDYRFLHPKSGLRHVTTRCR